MLFAIFIAFLYVGYAVEKINFITSKKDVDSKIKTYPAEISKIPNGVVSTLENEYRFSFARHHIVSKDTLIGFWDKCASTGNIKLLTPLLKAAMDGYKKSEHDPKSKMINKIESGEIVHDSTAKGQKEAIKLETIYVWMPWNLFIGPAERWDHVAENFETNCGQITGLRNRAEEFRDVENKMQQCIKKLEFSNSNSSNQQNGIIRYCNAKTDNTL